MVGIKDEVWAFGSLGCKLRAVFAAAGEVREVGLCKSFTKMLIIFAVAWCTIYHFCQFNKNKFVAPLFQVSVNPIHFAIFS